MTGSGGGAATGGAGSGGRGSGGVAATGGRSGTGGTAATGGRGGSGGVSGSGGSANPATCDQIAADYQTEMPNAKTCMLVSPDKQCQLLVPSALGCLSECKIYVQTATKLDEIARTWTSNNCDSIPRACPAIACIAAQPGYCAIAGTTVTPQCQRGPVATGS